MISDQLEDLSYMIEKDLEEQFGAYGLIFDEDEAILILSDLFERRGNITVVLGKRGSGKTAWAIRSAEIAQQYFHRKTALLYLEYEGIRTIYDVSEAENGTYLVIDEAELFFHGRRSLSKRNVSLSQILAISRHKDLSLVFVTQASNLVDRSILQMADYIIVKEPSMFQIPMEREAFYRLMSFAKSYFASLPETARKQVYLTQSDEIYSWLWRKYSHYARYFPRYYVEAIIQQYSIIRAKNRLPSRWSEKISKSFSDFDVHQAKIQHDTLAKLPDIFTPKDLAELLDVSERTAQRRIKEWRQAGLVKKAGRGRYKKIKK